MKERPILFSTPMVRAILDGRKTQTRRVAPIKKLDFRQKDDILTWFISFEKAVKRVFCSASGGCFTEEQARAIIASQFCPYGQKGDRLWVRETFGTRGKEVFYRATPPLNADGEPYAGIAGLDGNRWKSSIHMPRAASRITLEVTGVRVERLHGISEADAQAEGVFFAPDHDYKNSFKQGFKNIWQSINGPESWDTNPWVWVVEFKRVQP